MNGSEECLRRASEAECKAAMARSENLREGYLKIADEWRKKAQEAALGHLGVEALRPA